MRRARPDDIPTLVAFMELFYAESGYTLDRTHAERAFASLLAEERLGCAWLLDDEGRDAGYVVLTLRFGMEYGGMIACIDDLFVLPQHRNRGLSTAALVEIRDFCRSKGIRAITVEVAPDNGPAQAVYRRIGMKEESDRRLLALPLERPTHAG